MVELGVGRVIELTPRLVLVDSPRFPLGAGESSNRALDEDAVALRAFSGFHARSGSQSLESDSNSGSGLEVGLFL